MYYKLLCYIILTSILASCASQIPLSGGEKDTLSPIVKTTLPNTDNNTNYSKQYVTFEFDEPIQANNIKKELTIQPNITFKTNIKKKILRIDFTEPTKLNTTYTINLGSSIQDITEKNISKNTTLYFSTGPNLDSNIISGSLLSNNNLPLQNTFIGLYPNIDSVLPSNTEPIYFTNTTNTKFQLPHLPNKEFKLFAFQDKNNNRKWEPASETIGFLTNSIQSNTTLNKPIVLTHQDSTSIKLLSTRSKYNYYLLTFNRSIQNYNLLQSEQFTAIQDLNTLKLYPNKPIKDSLQILLIVTDSIHNKIDITTTLQEPFKKNQPTKLISEILPSNKTLNNSNQIITINLNEPIDPSKLNSSFFLLNDSLPDSIIYNNSKIQLQYSIPLTDTNNFYIPKNTLHSIYQIKNDSVITTFYKYKSSNFGTLSGHLPTFDYPVILELLTKENKLYYSESLTSNNYNITNIDPGTYILRIIHDKNLNGVYDNGNLYQLEQPELIQYYPKPIKIRANWDLESINIE